MADGLQSLSRRERQIMDVIFRLGEATGHEVLERLPDPPSYSAVRASLRILAEKGHVEYRQDGPRYVYFPTTSREEARRSALKRVVSTFFQGSAASTVAALLDLGAGDLEDEELERLEDLIRTAREEGR